MTQTVFCPFLDKTTQVDVTGISASTLDDKNNPMIEGRVNCSHSHKFGCDLECHKKGKE